MAFSFSKLKGQEIAVAGDTSKSDPEPAPPKKLKGKQKEAEPAPESSPEHQPFIPREEFHRIRWIPGRDACLRFIVRGRFAGWVARCPRDDDYVLLRRMTEEELHEIEYSPEKPVDIMMPPAIIGE